MIDDVRLRFCRLGESILLNMFYICETEKKKYLGKYIKYYTLSIVYLIFRTWLPKACEIIINDEAKAPNWSKVEPVTGSRFSVSYLVKSSACLFGKGFWWFHTDWEILSRCCVSVSVTIESIWQGAQTHSSSSPLVPRLPDTLLLYYK